jgi:hypothetical protein
MPYHDFHLLSAQANFNRHRQQKFTLPVFALAGGMALTGEFFRILVRRLVRLFPYSEFVASNSSKVRRAQLPRETETSAILFDLSLVLSFWRLPFSVRTSGSSRQPPNLPEGRALAAVKN